MDRYFLLCSDDDDTGYECEIGLGGEYEHHFVN